MAIKLIVTDLDGTFLSDFYQVSEENIKAAQALARQLRLQPEEVMCLGDAYSDSEMIQWAGIGVAMGNAEEGIKPLADFVSKRNDENGFAYALEKFVL